MIRGVALGVALTALAPARAAAQAPEPPARDARIAALVDSVSAARIERDVRTLAGFGTRHTLSDTLSDTRGIGAARRWIRAEMERTSAACGGCLRVAWQRTLVSGERRIPDPTQVVNVIAVLPGTTDPERVVVLTGHYDSRASDVMDATGDAPGADDDASGTAVVLEAARVLSRAGPFRATIVFAALAGEEQGLYGGTALAAMARDSAWAVEADLNDDIVGNVQGQDGIVDDGTVRVFSESPAAGTTPDELRRMRYFGGVEDSPSRQVARLVDRVADAYVRNLDVVLIDRLDRFGRGGDHSAFNDAGFPAVRMTEPNEDYRRQHQDPRVEDGVEYGDVADAVEFDYAAKVAALNVAAAAEMAWAPAPPAGVTVSGAVAPAATLRWEPVESPGLAGYRVWRRPTTAPTWTDWTWAGTATEIEMTGLPVDDWIFGVSAVSAEGDGSPAAFPLPAR